jgi:hypothetical protein
MIEKLRLDIPVLLPDVPDAADACVARLVGSLKGRAGVEQAHVVPAEAGAPAMLCVHFDPEVLTLSRIRHGSGLLLRVARGRDFIECTSVTGKDRGEPSRRGEAPGRRVDIERIELDTGADAPRRDKLEQYASPTSAKIGIAKKPRYR